MDGTSSDAPPTSSPRGEQQGIHGREDDKKILVNFLVEGALEERLSVVPILGAAGVGKTTLVRHIYNDPEVSKLFTLRGWMSASSGRRMVELMKAIAESLITGDPCNYNQCLERKLDCRSFLLVLDDVCYETVDGDQWEKLRATFSGCADGSVIIITTRDERVADGTGTVPSYMLESLSGDH